MGADVRCSATCGTCDVRDVRCADVLRERANRDDARPVILRFDPRYRVCGMGGRARFGVFDFDPATGELRRDGVQVKLQPQPARVLAMLTARPGEVVSRDELRQLVWADGTFVDFERGLNFCVAQIRSALGDSAESPRFVETLPRRGYRFIAPVQAEQPVSRVDRGDRTARCSPACRSSASAVRHRGAPAGCRVGRRLVYPRGPSHAHSRRRRAFRQRNRTGRVRRARPRDC